MCLYYVKIGMMRASLQFFFFVVGRMMKKRSIVQFFIFIYEEYIVHGSHVRVVCVCVNKIVMLFTNRSIGILYRRERERERGVCVDLVFLPLWKMFLS
mmetsp:Transcript_41721/g.61072  ORF Transcript_41721/g.61072 Transcript_41721/m.61072 type:complete len:98 (-) Transcript_41721:632-925(-)